MNQERTEVLKGRLGFQDNALVRIEEGEVVVILVVIFLHLRHLKLTLFAGCVERTLSFFRGLVLLLQALFHHFLL